MDEYQQMAIFRPSYDGTLEAQIAEIRALAAERISTEGDFRPWKMDDEETASDYHSNIMALEQRFESAMNVLRALLFDDVNETQAQYEQRLKAYVEYRSDSRFQSRKGSFRIGDWVPNGPVQAFNDQHARRNAAEAREAKIKESFQ